MKKIIFKRFISSFCALAMLCGVNSYAELITQDNENEILNQETSAENENIYAENEALSATSEEETLKKAFFCSYDYGNSFDSDVSTGGIESINTAGVLSKKDDGNGGYYWENSANSELGYNYVNYEGRNCVFTTGFNRGSTTKTSSGLLFYNTRKNADVSAEERHFFVEIDYFGNNASNLILGYFKSEGDETNKSSIRRVGNNEWNTMTFELNDMCLKSKGKAFVSGKADIRIEANYKDTYISGIRIYNTKDYETLKSAADELVLPLENPYAIDKDFDLPTSDDCHVEWSSDSEAITIENGTAKINPTDDIRSVALTAKIIKNNYYLEKTFDLAVAKKRVLNPVFLAPIINGGNISVDVIDADENIILVAMAQNKNTGKISDMDTNSLLNAESGTLSASVTLNADEILKYYIIDSSGASLKNYSPSAPKNFKSKIVVSDSGYDRILLSWDSSADDFNAVNNYVVCLNNSEIKRIGADEKNLGGESDYEYIPDINYEKNKQYNFSVAAIDHAGAVSAAAEINQSIVKAFIDLAETKDATEKVTVDGITFLVSNDINKGDSYTVYEEIDGVGCRRTDSRASIGKWATYLYFAVDKTIIPEDHEKVGLKIKYYDNNKSNITVRYINAQGESATKTIIKRTGTNQWLEASVELDDAAFKKSSTLTNADFRLEGDPLYIKEVTVIKR